MKLSPGSRNDETAICEPIGDSSGECVSTDAAGDGTDEGSLGGTDCEGVNSDNGHKRQISSSTSSSSSIVAQTARAGEAYRQVPKQLLAQCGDVRCRILKWVHARKDVKEL